MIKRVLSIFTVIGIVVATMHNATEITYAQNFQKNNKKSAKEQICSYQSNSYDLADNKNDKSVMTYILSKDKNNSTNKMDKNIEETLNETGVMDEEIEDMPQELINLLEEGNNYCTYINYSGVDSNGEIHTLTEEEVDEFFRNKMEDEAADKLISTLGIESLNASAKSTSDGALSKSGMLRQFLMLSQTSVGSRVYVYYSATWLETPTYRNTDACTIAFKNASLESGTVKAKYMYEYTESFTIYGKYYSNKYSDTVDISKNGTVKKLVSGVSANFDLHGSRSQIIALAMGGTTRDYASDKVIINFYVTVDNKRDMEYVVAQGDYWHEESSKSLNPTFSFDKGGISFSIAPEFKEYYNQISEGVYVKYYFK